MTEVKKGDRVRVTFEGTVICADTDAAYIQDDGNRRHRWVTVSEVKVLPPPVVTFKPGDVVRHKSLGSVFTIARGGYIGHTLGEYMPYDGKFTSEKYEKVELS